jgi:hypothetical protein
LIVVRVDLNGEALRRVKVLDHHGQLITPWVAEADFTDPTVLCGIIVRHTNLAPGLFT